MIRKKSNTIRVGAIENSGPNTLVSYLWNAGSAATHIDIAVAFMTAAGLESVLHVLKRTSSRGNVRLVTYYDIRRAHMERDHLPPIREVPEEAPKLDRDQIVVRS